MKKLISLSALIISASLLTGCVIHVGGDAQRADVSLNEELSLSATDIQELNIEAGAGSLTIVGVDGATEINVTAAIKTTEERNYTFTLEKSGDKAYLVAEHHSTYGYWIGSSPYLDLEVTVPSDIALDLDDGSGFISIQNINKGAKIVDGSGDISIKGLQNGLQLDDGSGSIEIQQLGGNLTLDDGSGSIYITKVSGDVNIEDGSGEMVINDVEGKVTVDDGSGDIEVMNAGSFELIEGGSGGLKIKDIKGAVNIDD